MASDFVGKASIGPDRPSMLAWRVHKFGPPEAMILERVPRPDPGPGEVLVAVHAAGVGPWDGWIRAGRSAPGGRLISAVSQPDQQRAELHGVTSAFFLVEVTTERLLTIAELIDRGELKTCVGAVLPLTDARDAHMMLEGQRLSPKGKIILNVEAAGEVTAPA